MMSSLRHAMHSLHWFTPIFLPLPVLAVHPTAAGCCSALSTCAPVLQVARAFNQLYDLHLTTRGEMELAYLGEVTTPSKCGGWTAAVYAVILRASRLCTCTLLHVHAKQAGSACMYMPSKLALHACTCQASWLCMHVHAKQAGHACMYMPSKPALHACTCQASRLCMHVHAKQAGSACMYMWQVRDHPIPQVHDASIG